MPGAQVALFYRGVDFSGSKVEVFLLSLLVSTFWFLFFLWIRSASSTAASTASDDNFRVAGSCPLFTS